MVAIPGVAEEGGGEGGWVEGDDLLLGRAPRAEGVGLVAVGGLLLVEPDGELVGSEGDELDEVGCEGG